MGPSGASRTHHVLNQNSQSPVAAAQGAGPKVRSLRGLSLRSDPSLPAAQKYPRDRPKRRVGKPPSPWVTAPPRGEGSLPSVPHERRTLASVSPGADLRPLRSRLI